MNHPIPKPDQYQEMREALRDLCGSFDSAYWQKIDHERGYPEAFVDAMTKAGWLAALIPEEYGGSGLGLSIAKMLSKKIGAEISFKSEENKGSTFYLRVPKVSDKITK